jgi:7 transmembrane receptor (rhodopsin family)
MEFESLNDEPTFNEAVSFDDDNATPHSHHRVVYVVAGFVIVTLAIGGNSFVIWSVVAHKRMRTAVNYFLVNVAVADVMYSTFCTMFSALHIMYYYWPFGRAFCRFGNVMGPCTIAAKSFTLVAISVER